VVADSGAHECRLALSVCMYLFAKTHMIKQ